MNKRMNQRHTIGELVWCDDDHVMITYSCDGHMRATHAMYLDGIGAERLGRGRKIDGATKDDAIRYLLNVLTDPHRDSDSSCHVVMNCVHQLRTWKYCWPELDVIEKSIRLAQQERYT